MMAISTMSFTEEKCSLSLRPQKSPGQVWVGVFVGTLLLFPLVGFDRASAADPAVRGLAPHSNTPLAGDFCGRRLSEHYFSSVKDIGAYGIIVAACDGEDAHGESMPTSDASRNLPHPLYIVLLLGCSGRRVLFDFFSSGS